MFHDIRAGTNDVAFKVGGNNAIIANKGEGLHDHLPPIAAICQRFQIARHASGKHHFGSHLTVGAKTFSLEDSAVFQHKIPCFPHTLNPFSWF